jgi:Uma2 family endonuclease
MILGAPRLSAVRSGAHRKGHAVHWSLAEPAQYNNRVAEVVEGQRTFTLEEYHRMGEAGVFAPGERVELVRGVIRRMSPKGRRHVQAVTLLNNLLTPALKGRAIVQIQDPVPLRRMTSEPEPDVCVLSSSDPRDAGSESVEPLLIVEIADTSLRFDREDKARIYAESAIPEYWIVNLVDDVLEVHRDPADGAYRTKLVLKPAESIAPLAFPDLEIPVRDVIP